MFDLSSSSVRIITDGSQKRSRIFVWSRGYPIREPQVLSSYRAILEAARENGIDTTHFGLLRWRDSDQHHNTPYLQYPTLFRHGGQHVDLHVRMR
jgi:hypothetical protein